MVLESYSTKLRGPKLSIQDQQNKDILSKFQSSIWPQHEAGTWFILRTAVDTLDAGLHDSSLCWLIRLCYQPVRSSGWGTNCQESNSQMDNKRKLEESYPQISSLKKNLLTKCIKSYKFSEYCKINSNIIHVLVYI